jgi:hypothetical protein
MRAGAALSADASPLSPNMGVLIARAHLEVAERKRSSIWKIERHKLTHCDILLVARLVMGDENFPVIIRIGPLRGGIINCVSSGAYQR